MQLTVIGTATLIGIYITQLVVEDLLTRRALASEAEHYWQLRDSGRGQLLPNTANLRGYLAETRSVDRETADLPPALRGEAPGFRRIRMDGVSQLVHVSDRDGARLYLVFEADQVSDLAFYFGTVPLSMVLLLIYGLLFVAYRWSQEALSPIVRLALQLESIDLDSLGSEHLNLGHGQLVGTQPGPSGDSSGAALQGLDFDGLRRDADAEVVVLINALEHFAGRLTAAVERERTFTRDAGHELRTPLAVFKGSLDLLERDCNRPNHERQALVRMRHTADEMESLLETLLLLARKESADGTDGQVSLRGLLREEIDAVEEMARQRGNRIHMYGDDQPTVQAPLTVLRIVLSNLLRNAVAYTENGEIGIKLITDGVCFEDSGIGMSRDELANMFEPFYRAEASRGARKGHGLGLSIVRRLARQYGWSLKVRSQLGEGTSVELKFRAD